jgi:hypothetical protein
MNLDSSAQTQNLQLTTKAEDLDSFLHLEFTRKDKKGSDKPTLCHTTSDAEGLLIVEYKKVTSSLSRELDQKDFMSK